MRVLKYTLRRAPAIWLLLVPPHTDNHKYCSWKAQPTLFIHLCRQALYRPMDMSNSPIHQELIDTASRRRNRTPQHDEDTSAKALNGVAESVVAPQDAVKEIINIPHTVSEVVAEEDSDQVVAARNTIRDVKVAARGRQWLGIHNPQSLKYLSESRTYSDKREEVTREKTREETPGTAMT